MRESVRQRYTMGAITLHWMIALLVIGQLAGGILMTKIPDEQLSLKFELYQWHKSFGVTILILTLARIGWRAAHKPPPLPVTMKSWEKAAAAGTHLAFYLLLILIPLLGWALVSSSPLADTIQTYLFGVIHLPHLPFFEGVEDREGVSHLFAEAHEYLAFLMIGLLVLHVGAALKHQYVDRNGVLARMLPLVK